MDCWITGLLIAYTACEREDVNRNIDIPICNPRYLVVFLLIYMSIMSSIFIGVFSG